MVMHNPSHFTNNTHISRALRCLSIADNYSSAIIKLYENRKKKSVKSSQLDEIEITDLFFDKKKCAKILASTIEKGEYQFRPLIEHEIIKKGKKRIVYNSYVLDKVVCRVLYDAFSEFMPEQVSNRVFSYIKGRNTYKAVNELASFIKKKFKDKYADLYLVYCDISSYTDGMAIDASSVLWEGLLKLLEIDNKESCDGNLWNMIDANVRPILLSPQGTTYQNIIGVPTGIPMTNICCNLYAQKLDTYLESIPNGFYIRYGDDFLFAHSEFSVFQKVNIEIEAILKNLRLKVNAKKKQKVYLTRAGRSCSKDPSLRGSSHINYLGFNISATGNISLGKLQVRRFYRYFSKHIRMCEHLLRNESFESRVKALVAAANNLLNCNNTFHVPMVTIMKQYINDLSILKQIDYQIALCIAQVATNIKGVRAFRKISRHELYNIWQLNSLYAEAIKK